MERQDAAPERKLVRRDFFMKKRRLLGVLLAGIMAFTGIPAVSGSLNVDASAASSATTSAKTAKLAAPKNFKATVSGTTVKLTWKKVTGADAYMVYKLNSETGKYETLKNVAKTSITIKGLKEGTYKFRVAALVKNGTKYTAQTKTSAAAVKIKAASTTAKTTASLPITFPAFGTSKDEAIKKMALTDGVDVGKLKDDVYAYGGIKKINGIDSMVLMYFNGNGKFFYGAVEVKKEAIKFSKMYSDIKTLKGMPDVNVESKGVEMHEWVDTKNEVLYAMLGYDGSGSTLYLAMSAKYAPSSISLSDGSNYADLFNILDQ